MKNILLVDDEPDILDIITDLLEFNDDFKVLTAQNGEQGLQVFMKEQIDLVITDIRMPVQNGLWLFDQIRGQDVKTPILFMSGFTEESEANLKKKNLQGFVRKPEDIKNLNDLVTKVVAS